jgi:hypothetical protein
LVDPTTGFLKIRNKEAAAPEEKPFAQRFDIFIATGEKPVSAGE